MPLMVIGGRSNTWRRTTSPSARPHPEPVHVCGRWVCFVVRFGDPFQVLAFGARLLPLRSRLRLRFRFQLLAGFLASFRPGLFRFDPGTVRVGRRCGRDEFFDV